MPSSGPRISPGAASTIITTPHSLRTSSFSGADNELDQFDAKPTPAVLAHKLISPWFASRAQPIAAEPPQIVAAADHSIGGLRIGRSTPASRNPPASSGR